MFLKLFKYLLLILFMTCHSCSDDPEYYNFLGDSLVTRWDLQQSFPDLLTKNYGLSGSGIEHIQAYAGKFDGQILVVLSGTNDLQANFTQDNVENYADDFIKAVIATGSDRIYIISVLPCRFNGNSERERNRVIVEFNDAVRARAANGRIHYIDVHDMFLKDGELNMQYSYDGLHLNPYGYEILNHQLNKYLQK